MNLHSDQINEISSALSKAQGEIKAAQKDGANPHYKSKFASLHSHWESCRAILAKNGLTVTQLPNLTEDGKNMLVTMLCHSSGQWFKSCMLLKPVKDDPQGMGSCLSYARRYMLSAIVGTTADDEDDDAEIASGRGTKTNLVPKNTKLVDANQAHELARLKSQIPKDAQDGLDVWLEKMFKCTIETLPLDQFEKVIDILKKKINFHVVEGNE